MAKSPTWEFETSVDWQKEHLGVMHVAGRPDIEISCPPVFCESPGDRWTPEEFYVASIEMCFMLTFKLFTERVDVEIDAFKSRAVGLIEVVNRKVKFTKVDIYPEIRVADETTFKKAQRLVTASSKNCLISESIDTKVFVHPKFFVGAETEPRE